MIATLLSELQRGSMSISKKASMSEPEDEDQTWPTTTGPINPFLDGKAPLHEFCVGWSALGWA